MGNYLEAEGKIIQRLKGKVPDVHVFGAMDLAGVQQRLQYAPAYHVLYSGDSPGNAAGRGEIQKIQQRWMVVVLVRNANDATGQGGRERAGELMSKAMEALLGWQPTSSHKALERTSGPTPAYPDGFAYFPMMFLTEVTVRGTDPDA